MATIPGHRRVLKAQGRAEAGTEGPSLGAVTAAHASAETPASDFWGRGPSDRGQCRRSPGQGREATRRVPQADLRATVRTLFTVECGEPWQVLGSSRPRPAQVSQDSCGPWTVACGGQGWRRRPSIWGLAQGPGQ